MRSSSSLGEEPEGPKLRSGASRRHLEAAEPARTRESAEYSARVRQLEQTVSALSVGLRQTRDDIERAAHSRAWRLGHFLTRAMSRLARRPTRTQGALVAALARIDRVQSAVHALPTGTDGGPAATLAQRPGTDGGPAATLAQRPGTDGGPAATLAQRPGTDGGPAATLAQRPGTDGGSASTLAPPAKSGQPGPATLAPRPPAGDVPLSLSPAQEEELARRRAALAGRLRARLGECPEREEWPLISAIVPTRNGLHHLKRLFAGLIEHTSYPALEVIVLDNASSDGTLDYLDALQAPFPVTVLASEDNLSFSEANARGAQQARGDLLLFLNNDIEPFEPAWLKELVCALDGDGVEAVGATLLHPEDLGLPDEEEAQARPLVQHRAIRFRWQDEMVKGFNHGDGEELWEGSFGVDLRAPAVTAACMLIARASFERVGGFDAGYRYGTEDVDLGLKLLAGGAQSAGVGRAVLYHRESSTQNRASSDFRRLNRLENRRLFLERWAPRVTREYRLARLRGDTFWADGAGAHVAITLTSLDVEDGWGDWYSGHEIGGALEQLGWQVSYVERKGDRWYELPAELDYVLSLMDPFDLRRVPEHVTTIAWIRNWTERWLEQPLVRARRRAAGLLAGDGRADPSAHRARHDPLPPGRQPAALPPAGARGAVCRRLRLHRQLVGQGPRHPAGACAP